MKLQLIAISNQSVCPTGAQTLRTGSSFSCQGQKSRSNVTKILITYSVVYT